MDEQNENVVIGEVQLVLAEKRTSLAKMRTGIAVFALPLTVLSVLVATSKYYDIFHVMSLLLPLLALCAALVILGSFLVIHALVKLRRYDRMILAIKRRHGSIADLIE